MPTMFKVFLKFSLVGAFFIELFVLLSKLNWFFELFIHYAHYYVLIGAFFALLTICKRQFYSALLWLVLVSMNLGLLAPYVTTTPLVTNQSPSLSIFAQNVYYKTTDPSEFFSTVSELQPDIFIANEANAIWGDTQSEIFNTYPYTAITRKTGVHGIFMGSKTPGTFKEIPLGSEVGLEFIPEGNTYKVLGVHPMAPLSPSWAQERNEQFLDLAVYVKTSTLPVIIVGDFNSTPWSPYFEELLLTAGLADARVGFGLVPTWKANSWLFHLPIDHALVSSEWQVLTFQSHPTKMGDHKGIYVELF